jgi:hypothetical protein
MMRNENCWEFQITQTRYPSSGTVHRPTFGGGDAGNKHLEVVTCSRLTKRTHIKTIENKSKVMWCDCH